LKKLKNSSLNVGRWVGGSKEKGKGILSHGEQQGGERRKRDNVHPGSSPRGPQIVTQNSWGEKSKNRVILGGGREHGKGKKISKKGNVSKMRGFPENV